ncbi:unnamed protein product [Caenorhabditis bovis]|uniref:Uncharacterized protein n=1 Tax=Caenorhabditis bovis TaxID=2654633 RepID=A0A8S1EDZ7_9PELO|nr:unnamed protein product [Caenorhabditis bovis]
MVVVFVISDHFIEIFLGNVLNLNIVRGCENIRECKEHNQNSTAITRPVYIDKSRKYHETLEVVALNSVDNLTSNTHITGQYFNLLATGKQPLRPFWPTLAAVLIIIFFFVTGLLACVYSLLSYALIEEDFRMRNDEREWLAAVARRQQIPRSPIVIFNDDASTATAIGAPSRTSVDSTQLSETV